MPDISCEYLYSLLPPSRRSRADSIRRPASRARSICAAALLYAVLDKPLGPGVTVEQLQAEELLTGAVAQAEDRFPLDWTPDPNGRPFPNGIRGLPERSGPLYVSLSHSGDWVAAALSDRPVGLDIQEDSRLREPSMRGILGKFHVDEQKKLDELAGAAFRDAFYRWWTMKESVMKLTGKGLALALNSFAVQPVEEGWYAAVLDGRGIRLHSRVWEDCWLACAQWET